MESLQGSAQGSAQGSGQVFRQGSAVSMLTPFEQAARLAVLAGGEEVLYQKARAAILSGDPRWASSLAEHLLILAPDRLDYHLLRDDALKAIGALVLSGSWRCFEPPALNLPAMPTPRQTPER